VFTIVVIEKIGISFAKLPKNFSLYITLTENEKECFKTEREKSIGS
jgi:hypothetical protein